MTAPAQTQTLTARISDTFWRRPGLLLAVLLTPPLIWLGVIYIGSLAALLVQSFFSIDEFSRAIMTKIVKKCGTRDYWEDWSASIAEIAKNHITRLTALLKDPDTEAGLRLSLPGLIAAED